MPLNSTPQFLAKLAYSQASRRLDLPEHLIEDATWYVDEAIGHMESDASYDPENYAVRLAERAIVAYVKARLLEADPVNEEEYADAYQQWFRKAVREWWEEYPTDTFIERLSKQVFFETIRETGQMLRRYDMDDCTSFVSEAVIHLRSNWGFDPETEEEDLSKRAVMDFAVTKMQGNEPLIAQSFQESQRQWVRNAARSFVESLPPSLGGEAIKLRLAEGANIRKEDVAWAEGYVSDAKSYLHQSFTFDPTEYATDLADKFAVDWAVHRLKNEEPTTSRGMVEMATAWAIEASREFIADMTEDNEDSVIAKRALNILWGEGFQLKSHHVDDALIYAEESVNYLSEVSTWDPLEDAKHSANRARIQFVRGRLKGFDAAADEETRAAVEQWLKAAGRSQETPDTYPDYPEVRKRILDHTRKKHPKEE